MPIRDDDEFDLTKYVLRLSKKIAQITKDYVGLPFSNTTGQLPFSIERRAPVRNKFYSTTRKWQRGDPLIGFYTPNAGQRKMILNLPDGSTLLDMCYPGWEVAVLNQDAMDHFFSKRFLFGDYYGHLLNGKPIHRNNEEVKNSPARDHIDDAMARQAAIYNKRRTSLQNAAEAQQRRGVSFDAQPEMPISSSASSPNTHLNGSNDQRAPEKTEPRILRKVTIASQSVRDTVSGTNRNRLVVQKTYSNGETETTEKNKQVPLDGTPDCDVEQLLASQLFNVFVGTDREVPLEEEKDEPSD